MRCLNAADVARALPMREAIEAMKRAFAELSAGAAVLPHRVVMDLPEVRGTALFMPSYLPSVECIGLKAITLFADNPQRGLPRIQALVCVLDGVDGRPLAVLDGASLTAIRTGATSGAATDLLANPQARRAAILGAGVQGRTQLAAVCAVRPIREAAVFDPRREAAEAFARHTREELGIDVTPVDTAAEAVRQADVVCAATTSATPVFDDADIAEGTHINAVGSYQPAVQEIPCETVLRALVVVDHVESALAETGDLLVPIAQGRFDRGRIHAELGELVRGVKPGRSRSGEITLFKSVGVAVQDLAAAACALRNAESLGIGTEIPW